MHLACRACYWRGLEDKADEGKYCPDCGETLARAGYSRQHCRFPARGYSTPQLTYAQYKALDTQWQQTPSFDECLGTPTGEHMMLYYLLDKKLLQWGVPQIYEPAECEQEFFSRIF